VNCDVNSGYTVPMLVEDPRILEASIFSILHKSRLTTVVGRLLHDIITIADEVDSQLKQTTLSYTDRSLEQDRRSPINSEPTGPRNSRFLRWTLQSVLFILQKVVEFLNQLHEFLVVLFLCDPLTQDMHAFSFIRGHGASRSDCAGNYSIADGRVNRNRRDSVQSQI
jgi:hypothetical protein